MEAALVIPKGAPPEETTSSYLTALARERGLSLNQEAIDAINALALRYEKEPAHLDATIARGTAVEHGEAARLAWEEGFDPEKCAETGGEGADETADFYNAISYIEVTEGTTIAKVVEPTSGVDGATVTGEVVKAKTGPKLDVKLDPVSLDVSQGGIVRAKLSGVLQVSRYAVRVSDLLEVSDVNFETGNIQAKGSVHVRCAVKDCFQIEATSDVIVDGLVEAATIKCGGLLMLRRGMAAREKGSIDVGGDVDAGFLDTVTGAINGSLRLRREMINCTLDIGADLIGETAVVVGGRTAVTGSVKIGTLGSGAEVATLIVLGGMPLLAQEQRELRRQIKDCEKQAVKPSQERMMLQQGGKLSAEQKERLTELVFIEQEIEATRVRCVKRIEEIEEELTQQRAVDLNVGRIIHAGTTVEIFGKEVCFTDRVKGPLRIGCNESGQILIRHPGGQLQPVEELARVRNRAA
jgi:uncharacterized protein (DUF342 family)